MIIYESFPITFELKTVIDGEEYGLKYKNESKYLAQELECARCAFEKLLRELGKITNTCDCKVCKK